MKNNRKNRKIIFIRFKNDLRLGKKRFYCTEKISNNTIITQEIVEKLMKTAKKSCFENYKLKLRKINFSINEVEEDFVKNLKTLQICLFN